MARINLLPWREAQRKEREKQFYLVLAFGAVLAASIVFYVNSYINGLIDNQIQRNQYLQDQIAIVDKQIHKIKNLEKEKKKLLARMEIIQKLQASRPQIVHLFDEIVRTLPNGIHLESIKRQGHTNMLHGVAESNARVSVFMRNLDASPAFENPRLDVIERRGDNQRAVRNFTLRVHENKQSANSQDDTGAL
ncbi:Fimbrial assembly family protein [Nitrosococcus halophilus Nc 4]|uniref:Fimbrial assembly family protein n=1 Tax=Nitrosococcus halophilus (strain Nc4) TaxID=472759 RepID=D5C3J5_NITHN|nr:PilN domain-containing protein [Nitrosococcus halophilus]ADE16902.1 Fimbrial assembly family protein [Nitrosococcus halophilus Nc 4]